MEGTPKEERSGRCPEGEKGAGVGVGSAKSGGREGWGEEEWVGKIMAP